MEANKMLRGAVYAGLFAILFIPLFVSDSLFFPFITGKNFAFRIIVEIGAALWLVLWLRESALRTKRSWLSIAIVAFLAVFCLADFFGVSPYRSFWSNYERMDGLVTLLHVITYFFLLISAFTTERLWNYFFHTSLGVALVASLYGFAQLAGWATINQGGVRLDATFGNATYLAVYMLFHIFITAYFFFKNYSIPWTRYIYIILAFVYTIILYHTATRGVILGLLGGVALSLVITGLTRKGKARVWSFGAVGALALVVLVFIGLRDSSFVVNSPTLARFASISFTEITTQSRFIIWGQAWKGFKERPLLGWGHENFNIVFNKYYEPELWRQETWFDRAHNFLFDTLVSAGLLGLLSYIAIFFSAFWMLWKKANNFNLAERSVLTGLLVAYLVQNLFVFDNLISYVMIFSILGFIHHKTIEERVVFPWFGEIITRVRGVVLGAHTSATAVLVAFVCLFVLYYANVKPIQANSLLLRTLYPRELTEDKYKLAEQLFGLDTFGSMEAREQYIFALSDIRSQPNLDQALFTKNLELARVQMLKQLERTGNDARHQLFMGSFLQTFGRLDEAIPHYTKALELSPKKQIIYFSLVTAYTAKGDNKKALEFSKAAFDLDPTYDRARTSYAAMAIRTGDDTLASKLLTERFGTALIPDQEIIASYAAVGQFSKVVSIWKDKVASDPNNPQYYLALAAAYYANHQDSLVISTLEKMGKISEEAQKQADYYIDQIKAGTLPRQ